MLSVVRVDVAAAVGMCVLVTTSACLISNDAAPDARSYDDVEQRDAPRPYFRDGGGCGGGASGTSGSSGTSGGCGPSGVTPVADAAIPDATPCDYHVFTYASSTASSVWVTGDFTGWGANPSQGAWSMSNTNGTWTVGGSIGAGRHIYKLIVDGTDWIADPGNPQQEPDGFGGQNSVVQVCGGGPD